VPQLAGPDVGPLQGGHPKEHTFVPGAMQAAPQASSACIVRVNDLGTMVRARAKTIPDAMRVIRAIEFSKRSILLLKYMI
jgi:hypothetical protein